MSRNRVVLCLAVAFAVLAACGDKKPPKNPDQECPAEEKVCEQQGAQQTKQKDTDETKPAPDTWKPLPGSDTGERSIDWLHGYATSGNPVSEGVCGMVGCFTDFLGDNRAAIVERCREQTDCAAKILCAAREVKAVLGADESNVCRNYAIAMWWVLSDLGLESDLECATTHAWVETTCDGKRVLVDAYNDIYIVVDE